MGVGKVKKVMSLRTSDEERQARRRERAEKRLQEKQQAMLQAVELAVTLPEPPHKATITEETTVSIAPTEQLCTEEIQKSHIGNMLKPIGSLIDRMRTFMLEE